MGLKFLILSVLLFIGMNSNASGPGSSGGGVLTESQMQTFLNRLDDYLYSQKGKQEMIAWLDVDHYDNNHPKATLRSIISSIRPSLVQHSLFYKGIERDCVSDSQLGPNGNLIRYFQCNVSRLPVLPANDQSDDVKTVYYLYAYRLVFHEVLVQAGLEDQTSDLAMSQVLSSVAPSDYPISSHLEIQVVKDWIPGIADGQGEGWPKVSYCFIREEDRTRYFKELRKGNPQQQSSDWGFTAEDQLFKFSTDQEKNNGATIEGDLKFLKGYKLVVKLGPHALNGGPGYRVSIEPMQDPGPRARDDVSFNYSSDSSGPFLETLIQEGRYSRVSIVCGPTTK